jgi:alginate O-acetyltransferase complex protein AlgI
MDEVVTMPRWVLMWAIAIALYAGCKWLTYACVRGRRDLPARTRVLGYLIAWPGMDAEVCLARRNASVAPPLREWLAAGLKIGLGIVLTWVVARRAWPGNPLVTGWIGMIGAIFVLHFGAFHLLSLAWRRAGVNAIPLMRSPIRSTSLSEFWGRRWNTAFHELASRFTFKPLRPWIGVTAATLTTFLVSGLIHELVISVPAGGGYGLPTGYFMLQGLGVAGERSGMGRAMGLGRGWRGWAFTVVVTAGPAYWLFPPPFVDQIILPMLDVIGAV